MTRRHGPADLIAVGFDGESVPDAVRSALVNAVESGVVQLLDLLVVSRDDAGEVSAVEAENLGDMFDIAGFLPDEQGLVGDEDVDEIAADLEPGQTVLVVLLEHAWARELTVAVNDSGGQLLATERIPAVVLDELAELAEQ